MTNLTQATLSDADFQEIRATTIGAHESPALFETIAEISGVSEDDDTTEYQDQEGTPVNAYGSPLSLWEMKSGYYKGTPPAKRSLWSRIKWGVCQDAIEDLGFQGRKSEGVYISTQSPHMSSRVEMEVSELDENWQPMIAKNVSSNTVGMWRNATGDWVVPESVQIEAQHHMAVRGTQTCYVVALFSGVTTKNFLVERDEELCQELMETVTDFWELVENGKRPRSKGARDQSVLSRLNAKIDPTQQVIDLRNDTNFQTLLTDKDKLKASEKEIKKKIDEIDVILKEKMDGIGSAIISDTHQIRWIKIAEAEVSYTKQASSYLRSSKINKKAAGTALDQLVENDN
jgi:hypothetical protein